jgi:DNA-binding NarL/FixJ family response regulator
VTKLRMAVWDPLPIFRQGLIGLFNGSWPSPDEPADLVRWAARKEQRVVVMTIMSAQDWAILKRLGKLDEKPIVVALLQEITIDTCIRALYAGAMTAVARSAEPEDIKQALSDALKGRSVLPSDVMAALVSRFGSTEEDSRISKRDIEWLRALSQGITVSQLAESMGYSERAMYRLLRDLYQRMDVKTRTEAVLKASQSGWI